MSAGLQRTFSSLSVPNYRRYFTGQVISISGNWMQIVAEMWLIVQLTGSGVSVGITAALQFLPMLLFGAWGGLIADRVPKLRLLQYTQALMAVPALTLWLLTATGDIAPWMVFGLVLARGSVLAIDNPARQAFVMELVGHERIVNAVSLNSVVVHCSRIAGPALAGTVIAVFGVGLCFAVNALSFVAMLVALRRMDRSALEVSVPAERRKGDVRLGLRYVRSTPALWIPLAAMVLVGLFSFNFQVLMPLLAHSTWHGTATTYAVMTMAMGVGSVGGALLSGGRNQVSPRLIVGAAAAFGVFELLASVAPSLPLQILALVPLGAVSVTFAAGVNSSLQLAASPEMRGRVMSLYSIVFMGSTPIGAPLDRLAGAGREPARRPRGGRRRGADRRGRRTRGVRAPGRGHTQGIDPAEDTRARRYRLGLIVPSSNVTMETEIPALLRAREPEAPDERFTFHSSRMRMRQVTPEELRAMNEQTGRAAAELADARCDVVATACLVALMAQGPGFHCTAEDQIREVLRAEDALVPVVSSAGALLDGLRALGARQDRDGHALREAADQARRRVHRGGRGRGPRRALARGGEQPRRRRARPARRSRSTGAGSTSAAATRSCSPPASRCPRCPSIDPVERACGLPVLSAATATTFAMLDALGLPTRIPRAGRLLSGEVAALTG